MAESVGISVAGRSSHPQIVRLQAVTIAWMLMECAVALGSAWAARSPALLAFGADSFVELLSAGIVLLQFSSLLKLNRAKAARYCGILLYVLAVVVAVTSIAASFFGKPEPSLPGIAIALAALVVMPILSLAKRRIAQADGNAALAADAVQSAACAYLAGITLLGLAANALFSVHWLDPAAALVAVPFLIAEGNQAMRGKLCDCC